MKFFSLDKLITTILVFISILFFWIVLSLDLLEPFWHTLLDFRVTDVGLSELRTADKVKADTRIVLVNIEKLNNLELARLIATINQKEPKVIGIEKILKRSADPQQDKLLAMVLDETNNLVMAQQYSNWHQEMKTFTNLEKSSNVFGELDYGFNNLLIGKNRKTTTVRQFAPLFDFNGKKDTLFSLKIAARYSHEAGKRFFLRENDKESIFYRGNFEKFFYLDAYDIFDGRVRIDYKDKIILLGTVQPLGNSFVLQDVYFTPLNEISSGTTYPDMYGLVIHANIISMILDENYYNYLPEFISFLFAFILCYVNIVIYSYICYYKKDLYEISALAIFVVESIIIMAATVKLHHDYNFEAELTIAIYAIIISGFTYEGYNYSLKPLILKIYYTFSKRSLR